MQEPNYDQRNFDDVRRTDSLENPPELDQVSYGTPINQSQAAVEQHVDRGIGTLLHFNKRATIVTALVFVAVALSAIGVLAASGFRSNDQNDSSNNALADKFLSGSLEVGTFADDGLDQVSQANRLAINGQLSVGNTLVLTPTGTPSTPQAGQLYYDQSSNTPFVYNGNEFVSLVTPEAEEGVLTLGGVRGVIGVDNGLAVTGQSVGLSPQSLASLNAARVTSVQGQSGVVTFAAGQGIAINGTTISNTGVRTITGASGITVAQNNGTATITLPQLLGTANTPTFAGVQLNSALAINSGGTGSNGASYQSGGVVFYNGTSFATTTTPATDGLCLLSSVSGPVFDNCAGASSGVTALNGLNGILTLNNASTSGQAITLDDATATDKGIASFASGDFSIASGAVSLSSAVTKAGNTFNGSGNLVRLDTGGQASLVGQCLRSTASGVAFSACPVGGNINSGSSQTAGRLTKFDATTNTITDSIASESGSVLSVSGTLAATNLQGSGANITNLNASNLTTGTVSVARGGTGANTLTQYGVLFGNGTSAIAATTAGTSGQCLISNGTGSAPTFQTCTGAGGVASVNGINGVINLLAGNGLGVVSAGQNITFAANDATTSVKGVASYNSSNFTVSSGAVNTIQGIGTSATPTFANLILQSANSTISGTGANGTTQLRFASQSGNDTKTITIPNATGTVAVSASGPLQLDANGNISCASCLTDGSGGGGAGGVTSVNTLNGALTISAGSGITVTTAGSDIEIAAVGATGVTSLNGASGSLTIANASESGGTITLNDATTSAKGIASFTSGDFTVSSGAVSLATTVTKAGNTFNGVGQLVQLNGTTGNLPALNASALTNLNANNITTGTLGVARGGTGVNSLTQYGIVYGNGTGALAATTAGTSGQCLVSNGTGSAPTFQTCTGAGGVASVNGFGGSVTVAAGSGVSISNNTGTITVANTGVTQVQGTTNQVIASGGTGNVTLSLPQNIHTGAAVQFASATLTGANSLSLGQGSTATGSITFRNDTNNFTTRLVSGVPAADVAFTLPSADGSTGQCLKTNASGVLSFGDCLTGGAGGSGGVSSLNGLSGALSVANASASGSTITLNDATTSAKGIASFTSGDFTVSSGAVSLVTSVTKQGNTFNGVGQLVQLNGTTGNLPALNASALTNLNASNLTTGTVSVARGGTGANTLTQYGVLFGNGTSAIAATTAGTSGQCLISNGTGSAPTFQTCTGAGGVASVNGFTGAVSIAAGTGVGVTNSSGTVTIANTGVTQVQGTSNQVSVSGNTGNVTFSLPQNIHTGAGVQFATAALTGAGSLSLGQASTNTGSIIFRNDTNNFTTTLLSGAPSANVAFTLPSADGVSGQCLKTNASGVLSFGDCLTGSSGGSGGVSSLNGLSGSLSVANASASGSTITLNDATTSAKGIASFTSGDFTVSSGAVSLATTVTKAGNTFNGVGQLVQLNGTTGNLPALNASALTNLNANNITTGTLGVARGGTGANTLTQYGVLFGNGTGAIGVTAVGSAGQCLTSNGSGSAPTFQACAGAGGVSSVNTFTGAVTVAAGTGVSVSNSSGTVTVANTGVTQVQGTTNQVIASGGTGNVTLSLPQSIATTSTVQFGAVNVGTNTNARLYTATANNVGYLVLDSDVASEGGVIKAGSDSKILYFGEAAATGNYVFRGTGKLNISGGALQTAGADRLTNAGNLVNIGTYSGTGDINTSASIIAQSGLYTGPSAGTLRITSSGGARNLNLPTSSSITIGSANAYGVTFVDSSNVLQFANVNGTNSYSKCLLSNGTNAIGFGDCPSGSGGGSGYANGGNNYTNNGGTSATTRIATSYDETISNPVLGLSSNYALDIITNNYSRINIANSGQVRVLSNSAENTDQFSVRTRNEGDSAQYVNALVVDTSSAVGGRVGIGLTVGTTPQVTLDIGGGSNNGGGSGIQIRASGAPGLSNSGGAGAGTASTGRIYYDQSARKFKVSENGGAYVDLIQGSGGAISFTNGGNSFSGAATLGTTDSNSLSFIVNNTTRQSFDTSNNVTFNNNYAYFRSMSNSLLMQLDHNSGSVNINTTSSVGSAKLNVNGGINVTNGNAYHYNGSAGSSLSCGGGNQALGSFSFSGGILISGSCSTNNSDLAEAYNSSDDLQPGELVMAAGTAPTDVVRATAGSADGGLMGIVSTEPAQTIGTEQVPDGYPIALSGRVPTLVNGEGGAIAVGDQITISSVPGVGKKATGAGMIVGTAVESFDGNGQGSIEVFVNLTYFQPTILDTLHAQTAEIGDINVSGLATIQNLQVTGLAQVHDIEISGHIITTGGQPTASTLVAAGTDAAVAVVGTDAAGKITITTGTSVVEGEQIAVLFSELYGDEPRVVLSPSNKAAASSGFYKSSASTDGFVLSFDHAPAAQTTYVFDYFIAQ